MSSFGKTMDEHNKNRTEAEARRDRAAAEATRDAKAAIDLTDMMFGPINAMLGGMK